MNSPKATPIAIMMLTALLAGCCLNKTGQPNLDCDPTCNQPNLCSPTYLDLDQEPCLDADCELDVDTSLAPIDPSQYDNIVYSDMSLQQCIQLALQQSKIFRDLGGTLIRSPGSVGGVFDPASVFTDPQFSENAALAAFDANVVSSLLFQQNDRASNLTFQGDNGIFTQDFNEYSVGVQKLAATGTFFATRHRILYDNSNQTGQTLPHSWEAIFESEFRHPLLQGAGSLFNRIAGPSTTPGVLSGVLIARTNTEISLTEFRQGVRDLVSEVENAYWDLYFSYRNLEATTEGRDKAYEVFVAAQANEREGTQGLAQAKEQYLRLEAEVFDAMEGRPTAATRNNNGTSGGVFQSIGGVRVAERRLRLLIGMPINGAEIIKPSDEPVMSGIEFDWHQSVHEAFTNRQELKRQRWVVKQRELELLGSENFLKPRLDLIGQYRVRGIGQSLTGGTNSFQNDQANGTQISNAFGDLVNGDFQEWQVGAEFSMPSGFRAAHLGVRNAELTLAREQTILREQKREVVFGLSNAIAEFKRAFTATQAAEQRYVAAREFQFVMSLEVERGRDRDIELEAQRRVVEAKIQFRRTQVEYMLALKNVHFEKGSYLDFCNVRLAESSTNPLAANDAADRRARRGKEISYISKDPIIAHESKAEHVACESECGE